jgi:aminoglycoside phosphotransferase (APT) family kinase protein
MREALHRWLAEVRGDSVGIAELRRIATGNSRAMWFLRMEDGERYVARVEQGGVFGTSGDDEFRFMEAAHALGCAVARVRWSEPTGAVIGAPFFVMDFVEGVPSGRDDRSMSPELAIDFVRRLDDLHRTDWRADLHLDGEPADATHREIERWHGVYLAATDGVVVPLLEEGAAWLHHHAATPELVGIVHGDPGPGNMVHDGRRVLAFTDWEFSHLGDPMEDWVYLVTMRGSRTMSAEEWRGLFEREAGVRVTDRDLTYWSAFNYFKGACANATCRRVFATTNPAPNMGIIGTALHQTYVRQLAGITTGPP